MGILIDSGVFVAAERGLFDLGAWLELRAEDAFALSAVSVSELLHGVHRAPAGRRRDARQVFVAAILDTYPVVPFDADAALAHARVWAELLAKGRMIGAHDLLIAATALSREYGVATFNRKHFERVPGLNVVVPASPMGKRPG